MRPSSWQTPARGGPRAPQPPRHWLIRLHRGAWAGLVADGRALPDDPLLRDWTDLGRPLIARRREAGDRVGHVAAGIALPPASGKLRVALDLRPKTIAAIEPPPALAAAQATAPQPWHDTFDALATLACEAASEPRVFGSFAWQALTGLPYVAATSDLDLLWPVTAATDMSALFAGLRRIERHAPGRLDGELVHEPTGAAVHWRELAGDAQAVLVKTAKAVALQPRDAFLQRLAT